MSDAIEQIRKEVEGNKLVIFMKGSPEAPRCGFSAAASAILKEYGYPFKGIDILANPEVRAKLPEYSSWPTFPQIFLDGKLIGGCDILHELKDSGELDKMLKEAFGQAD